VFEVQPNGIRIEGACVRPGTGTPVHPDRGDQTSDNGFQEEFFLKNYPYQCVESQNLSFNENLTAKEDGIYTYQTVEGNTRVISKLDYGVPCAAPAELVENAIRTAKEQADARADAIKNKRQAL
jgi:hypothetical protein